LTLQNANATWLKWQPWWTRGLGICLPVECVYRCNDNMGMTQTHGFFLLMPCASLHGHWPVDWAVSGIRIFVK
jgi:hypothetical protein